MTCPFCGCHSYVLLQYSPNEIDQCMLCGAIHTKDGWQEKERTLLDLIPEEGEDKNGHD